MSIGTHGDGPTSPPGSSSRRGPSSLLERMVDDLGGWGVVNAEPERLIPVDAREAGPLAPGVVIAGRYQLGEPLLPPARDMFRAQDSTTRQPVLIQVLTGMSLDPSLTARFAVARAVSHANVARVHDLVPTPWGPAIVMDGLDGEVLASRVAAARAQGGVDLEKFRSVASDIFAGLTAIHAQGLAHGGIDTGTIILTARKAVILDLGFFGPTPSVVALEPGILARRAADDVRRAALVCWDMWATQPPGPFVEPRSAPLRSQAVSELPSRLSSDELRQIFDALSEDPMERPRASRMRLAESGKTPAVAVRYGIDAGAPASSSGVKFVPEAQNLMVTFAQTAPELIGTVLPLSKPVLTIGRSDDSDLVVAERTVSFRHARISWQRGSWLVEDLGSTNGTFTEDDYARQSRTFLRHGGEIQLGEMRLMLVGFRNGSPQHLAVRRALASRDPLTGLLNHDSLARGLAEDARFADWADVPMVQARFRVESHVEQTVERLTVMELLTLRRIARRVAELTGNLLLSTRPVVAGRAVHSDAVAARRVEEIVVSILAATDEHARNIVSLVLADARALLPPSFSLSVTIAGASGSTQVGPPRHDAAPKQRRPPTWRS